MQKPYRDKRIVFLVDVDGTVADLARRIFSVLYALARKRGFTIDPEAHDHPFLRSFLRAVKEEGERINIDLEDRAHALAEKFLRAYVERRAEELETIAREMAKDEKLKEILREAAKRSIYPEVIPALRELAGNGEVVLFSRTPHTFVRLLADVLRESGIHVKALGADFSLTGTNWERFKELAAELSLVPSGRRVQLDNPDTFPVKDALFVPIMHKEDLVHLDIHKLVRRLRKVY